MEFLLESQILRFRQLERDCCRVLKIPFGRNSHPNVRTKAKFYLFLDIFFPFQSRLSTILKDWSVWPSQKETSFFVYEPVSFLAQKSALYSLFRYP
ncbi:hypothetical protein D3C72_1108220 [compost metagenome]